MGVHKPRQHNRVVEVDGLARWARRGPAAYGGDSSPLDHEPGVVEWRARHRDEPATAEREAVGGHNGHGGFNERLKAPPWQARSLPHDPAGVTAR